jgi:hypothetical protein
MNEFHQDLAYSLEERENEMFDRFYYRVFPGLKLIEFANDMEMQRKGIDKILHFRSGKTVTIDEKKRRVAYDDILLELISVVEKNRPGWLFTCQCDYIVYAIMPRQTVYLLPTLLLKTAWTKYHAEWLSAFKTINAWNNGYSTRSIIIPSDVLLKALSEEMVQQLGAG